MNYIKQGFKNGQTLSAEMLIKIENGIISNSAYLNKLNGKKLSILGDSISSFRNMVVAGNGVYYPAQDVQSYTDTYWGKFLEKTGMELGVNNSWAGKTVSEMATDANIVKLGNNGTPDIIFVYLGTNDLHLGKEIGELDTSSPYDMSKTELDALETDTIHKAFKAIFLRIQHYYPDAKIFVLGVNYRKTDDGSSWFYNEYKKAMKESSELYGAYFIDLAPCMSMLRWNNFSDGSSHPNKKGHERICERVYNIVMSTVAFPLNESADLGE